ncbi:MAG: tRNA(Ile)-lysidine synthetase, tRNA(Ile)-lysidine synthase [Candidatus Peregrinibacteria bacterium GW2011_GWF2_43_17]|nr:MAG: tRNA(Ile)-lysidine synthetase, tRNA(Ile)-lysidine synthase [Candidatus Peregrinibacteria bacterium GW2011_GWF2_43_17]KKT20504.1 MAG: tRNA(Ile)-lysidine synthase [Candidatus Peregrinibacteria bacterium GW2011_GWA2_43_8]HAU40290.1 tRNA lysidine(34) synthetase TilS [Candidatus Peregrinibacteria bacterium]
MKKILAFSGGPDSIYLLQKLLAKGEKPILAHLNHNLRGQESDADELFCKQIAKKYNLVIETEKITLPKKNEETARIVRYNFLERVRKKHNAEKILTAHHLNDSIETLILNLTRGTGLRGLTGIKSDKIERPLLNTTKQEILSYLKKHNLPYRKDSSNSDPKYSRNRIRLKIIPELKKINPNLEKTFLSTIENLKSVQAFIDSEIEHWTDSFDTKKFAKLHPYLQSAVLLKTNRNLSKKNIAELKKLIAQNKTGTKKLNMKIAYGKAMPLPGELKGTSGKHAFYCNSHLSATNSSYLLDVPLSGTTSSIFTVFARKNGNFATKSHFPEVPKPTFSILTTRPIFLDFDKIGDIKKLRATTFKPGDKIKPLGLNGKTQKLQDLFTNKKIPQEIRKEIPVIKLGKEIICVGWLAIADKYKITKTTGQILKISWSSPAKASKIKKLK